MEEMRKAAIAYYNKADKNEKQKAVDFFNSIDTDGNGKISLGEFEKAFELPGGLFNKLDASGDRHLDFYEVMAFYYFCFKHGATPFCDGCSTLLAALYFSCLDCHLKGGDTYDLCCDCYRGGNFNHNHNSFYDNHHLLVVYRKMAQSEDDDFNAAKTKDQGGNHSQKSNYQSKSRYERAMEIISSFNTGFAIGSAAASACSIM